MLVEKMQKFNSTRSTTCQNFRVFWKIPG